MKMGMERDHLNLVKEGLGEAERMTVHILKVGAEEVGGHLDLAEEVLRETARMISSAH
jgi:hypothetical protein